MVETVNGPQATGAVTGAERRWIAEIVVEPKPGVNDPQGEAVLGGLKSLGYEGVSGVRSGRFFRVRVSAMDEGAVAAVVGAMCERLLANPVIEIYAVAIVEEVAVELPIVGASGAEGERQ